MGREIEGLARFVAETRWDDIPAPVHFGLDSGGRLLVASGDGGIYLVTPEPGA